jgi:hypothetical protein
VANFSSIEQASYWNRDTGRIEQEFAVLHDGDHDRPIWLPAVMQDEASSEIDNEVMRKAGDAKVVGKFYGLVEIAG